MDFSVQTLCVCVCEWMCAYSSCVCVGEGGILLHTRPSTSVCFFSYQVALSLQHHDQQMMAEQEAAWGQFHSEYGASQNAE